MQTRSLIVGCLLIMTYGSASADKKNLSHGQKSNSSHQIVLPYAPPFKKNSKFFFITMKNANNTSKAAQTVFTAKIDKENLCKNVCKNHPGMGGAYCNCDESPMY